MELGLAGAFFKQSYHPSAQLDLVEAVCNVLYDSMRPIYIQLQDPADLVGLIDVLKQDVRSDALTHRDLPASAMAERAVSRITQDVQERLIFRSAVCASAFPLQGSSYIFLFPIDSPKIC